MPIFFSTYYLWLLLFYNDRHEWFLQRQHGLQSLKYLLSSTLWKVCCPLIYIVNIFPYLDLFIQPKNMAHLFSSLKVFVWGRGALAQSLYSESESHSAVPDSLQGSPWNSPGQNTGVDSISLLQGIFPTQGLNPGLPHCRRILYQLSHKHSAGIYQFPSSLSKETKNTQEE